MLRKYFITVEMTELSTKELIQDPGDVALLEKYNSPAGQKNLRSSWRRFGLVGGEREVFFTPDGKMVDIFLSLHCGEATTEGQKGLFLAAARAAPESAVERFFEGAATAFEQTAGALPRDWKKLRDGTAPEVEQVRREVVKLPEGEPTGLTLRVSVRADVVMYERLVGFESIHVSDRDARRLLPGTLVKGGTQRWPRQMMLRLGRVAYPRGAGVLVTLADASIHGSVETEITEVEPGTVRGRFSGSFQLAPTDTSERSRRPSYSPYRSTSGDLIGDFEWNVEQSRFTKFRLVSRDATSKFHHGRESARWYQLGVELVLPVSSTGIDTPRSHPRRRNASR